MNLMSVFQSLVLFLSLQERLCLTKIRQVSMIVCVSFPPLKISPSGFHGFISETSRSQYHRFLDLDLFNLRLSFQVWIWDPGAFDFSFTDPDLELWRDLRNTSEKEMKFSFNRIDGRGRHGYCLLTIQNHHELWLSNDQSSFARIYESQRAMESQAEETFCMMKQNEALCIVYVDAVPVDRGEPNQFSFLAKYDQQVEKESWIYTHSRFSKATSLVINIKDQSFTGFYGQDLRADMFLNFTLGKTCFLILSVNVNVMLCAFWSFISKMIANKEYMKMGHNRFYLLAYKTSDRKAWFTPPFHRNCFNSLYLC